MDFGVTVDMAPRKAIAVPVSGAESGRALTLGLCQGVCQPDLACERRYRANLCRQLDSGGAAPLPDFGGLLDALAGGLASAFLGSGGSRGVSSKRIFEPS